MDIQEYIKSWQVSDKQILDRFKNGLNYNLIYNLTTLSIRDEELFNHILHVLKQFNLELSNQLLHEVMCNLAGV